MTDNYLGQDGAKRAQDLSQAWMGVSGYADDSMFFVARYGRDCSVGALSSDLRAMKDSYNSFSRTCPEQRSCCQMRQLTLRSDDGSWLTRLSFAGNFAQG